MIFINWRDTTHTLWLWRWLPPRSPKRQSLSTTTVLFRTTFNRTIKLNLLLKWLLGSNLSQKGNWRRNVSRNCFWNRNTGDAPVIYWPMFFLELSNSSRKLCESQLVLVSVLLQNRPRYSEALGSKLQIFHDSMVSQFPKETWVQRKLNHIKKNDQKAWESCYNFDISWAIESLQ